MRVAANLGSEEEPAGQGSGSADGWNPICDSNGTIHGYEHDPGYILQEGATMRTKVTEILTQLSHN